MIQMLKILDSPFSNVREGGGVELVSFFTNIISDYMPTLITSYTNNIFTLYGK